MRRRWMTCSVLLALALAACAASASGMSAAQAAQHIGETATVCGTIASAHYASGSNGQPTFINLDKPYPEQVFTVVIFGDYRGQFSRPPETWTGHLCVTGRITAYHGKPEIKVFKAAQVRH